MIERPVFGLVSKWPNLVATATFDISTRNYPREDLLGCMALC
jgi:hypothetical protein